MSITVTPGYTWVNGEVETATKLNMTATPTIAGDQTYTFNNGAAATPSINFTGSTTTGLFYSATGVGISAAGVQYAFLNSNGLHLGNDFSTSVSTQFNIFQTNGTAQVTVGQDSTHNLNFRWDYNATPASAAAVLTTFGQNNPLTIQASAIAFDSTSLANAVQITGSGRVRVGGGADDGVQAFQVSGALHADGYVSTPSTLTYGATTTISFLANDVQTVSLTGNVTFATSNLAAGRGKVLRIIGDGSVRTFTFPASWTFVGNSAPASIAASKTAILSLASFSTLDSGVIAAYAVQI